MNAILPPRIAKDKPKRPLRLRCPAHLSFVRSHMCCVVACFGRPIEAAHVRGSKDGGLGFKPGDNFAVSLCQEHHAEQHAIGEAAFQARHGIDMLELAETFWRRFQKHNPSAARRAEMKAQSR